jgi:general secretion pathway protein D
LLLHVKPSINESGLIDLEIDQEVSDILDKSTNNTPTLSKRSVSTDVSVEDGKTIVIGGLIKDKDTHDDNGVPYLKDVPLLGSLFRYQQKAVERTELLLTITPYIVRTPSDAERLSQELDAATAALRRFAAEKAMGRHVSTSPIAATPLPGATH